MCLSLVSAGLVIISFRKWTLWIVHLGKLPLWPSILGKRARNTLRGIGKLDKLIMLIYGDPLLGFDGRKITSRSHGNETCLGVNTFRDLHEGKVPVIRNCSGLHSCIRLLWSQ